MKKKILLTWDLDGFIGVVNSTMPYDFNFDYITRELEWVNRALDLLQQHQIKTTFAITGFSAEKGLYPYSFPELIKKIADHGHEVASHSWRHEWVPVFRKKQIDKSLARSKKILEGAIGQNYSLSGFVPPHNKPATWIRRGAYSLEDFGLFPFFKMGDVDSLLNLLKKNGYKWARIAHNPFINRLKKKEFTRKQRVYNYKGMVILENHYTGFDERIIRYIEETEQPYFTISAHPAMLDLKGGRPESWEKFEKFINHFANRDDIKFVRPMDILADFGIR